MSLLATLMLAASIQSAAPIAAPVAHTDYAQATLTRQIAAQAASVRRQAVREALDTSRRQFARVFQDQLATTRIRSADETQRLARSRRAKTLLDREVARNERALRRRAVSSALNELTNSARDTLVSGRKASGTAERATARVVVTRPMQAE